MSNRPIRPSPSLHVAAGLLATLAGLPAQGAVSPTVLRPARPTAGLDPTRLPMDSLSQVYMVRLPGYPAQSRTCALSGRGLAASAGGAGGLDLLTGTYDLSTDTFVPDGAAASLNTAADEFGLTLSHDGLLAVYDRLGAGVMVAGRSTTADPFTPLGPVSGLPPQSYYDPALGRIDGKLNLLFVEGNRIAAAPIELVSLTLLGPPRPIVLPARPGSTANSPTPIFGWDGALVGVSHHDVLAGDNDHYLALDLDPATPSVLALDTPGWINNGGFAGGRFFSASSSPAPYHVIDVDLAFMPSVRVWPGDGVFLPVLAGYVDAPDSMHPPILIGPGYLPSPIRLPGITGDLGVDPTGLIVLWGGWDLRQGSHGAWVRMPADEALYGQRLAVQSIVVRGTSLSVSNTAAINMKDRNDCDITVAIGQGQSQSVPIPGVDRADGVAFTSSNMSASVANNPPRVVIRRTGPGDGIVMVDCTVDGVPVHVRICVE